MALDATVAGAAANSYLTLVEAAAFAAVDPILGEKWLADDDAKREQLLQAATSDVDTYKRSTVPYSSTQALLFPRDVDVEGDPALPVLLAAVKRATYEQAVYLLDNAHLIAQAASHRAHGLLSSSDDDGSWNAAVNPSYGLYAPRMREALDRIGASSRTGRYLVSVPIASSFPS